MQSPNFIHTAITYNSEDMHNSYFCIPCDEVAGCSHLCYENYTKQIHLETKNTQETYWIFKMAVAIVLYVVLEMIAQPSHR